MSTPASFYPHVLHLVPGSARATERLQLSPTGSHLGMLDGGWWPRSRDPLRELPGLVLAIDGIRGNVLRLVLAATGWDERPRRLGVGGRSIIIDYFGSQPASLLTATCVSSRVDLLVIPPSTSRDAAYRALMAATVTANRVAAPETPRPRNFRR